MRNKYIVIVLSLFVGFSSMSFKSTEDTVAFEILELGENVNLVSYNSNSKVSANKAVPTFLIWLVVETFVVTNAKGTKRMIDDNQDLDYFVSAQMQALD